MTTEIDKTAAFALVKRARALVVGVNASTSTATISQYEAAFARMSQRQAIPEEMANTSKSFYYYRAAWVHHFSAEIRATLSAADVAQRAGDSAGWKKGLYGLPKLIHELERYRPDPEKKNLAKGRIGAWAVEAEKRSAQGIKQQSHSKRQRLRGLPADWRSRMFSGLASRSKYRELVAVLSATGARPEEFTAGITVTITGDAQLNFHIRGAKTSGGKYGQDERTFSVKADRPELTFLLNQAALTGGRLVVRGVAGSISDRVRQLSSKVFPLLKAPVSAYVFRHQMASDLKASGLSDADVSAALGHSVDETKGRYGAAQSARSIGGVTNVKSTRPVLEKTKAKVKALERSRSQHRDR
jgi:integrase